MKQTIRINADRVMQQNKTKNVHTIKLDLKIMKLKTNRQSFNSFYIQAVFMILLGFMLCVNTALAADAAATVFFKSGNVTANSSEHGLRQLEKDDAVYSKDEVDTADNGRAQLRFTDGGLVSLMPGSIFSVEEYLFDEADEGSSAVFGLLKGGLRTVTGAIGRVKHEEYELKTPIATLGIRGTEFTVVLQNADTLLVHVGRGKVVITNDSGSLEVHDGQNAIVRLGNAPEFTDQEPMFLATSVTGDDLELEEEPNQNPHIADVLTDVPPSLEVGVGEVVFHADLEPRLLLVDYQNVSGGSAINPNTLYNIALSNFTPGAAWDKDIYGSNEHLEWGNFKWDGGSGFIGVVDGASVHIDDYGLGNMPYITGNAMVNFMPAGTLNYSLDSSGSPMLAYSNGTSGVLSWSINKFDLGLNLASSSYSVDFAVTGGSNADVYASNGSGSLNSGSVSQNFGFTHNNVTLNGGACGVSSGCNLEVNGFLAGNDAQAAGVNFKVDTGGASDGDIYGAVPLKHTGGNTGLGGGGGGAPGLGG